MWSLIVYYLGLKLYTGVFVCVFVCVYVCVYEGLVVFILPQQFNTKRLW